MAGRDLFYAKRGIPGFALLFLFLGGLACVPGFLNKEVDWFILSAPLFLSGIFLLLIRRKPFKAEFGADGIEVFIPHDEFIAYNTIDGLTAAGVHPGSKRNYLIRVTHANGVLDIPSSVNVPSRWIYEWLDDFFPLEGSRDLPHPLAEHLREEEERFSPRRLWCYGARACLGGLYSLQPFAICSGCTLGFLFWLLYGLLFGNGVWIGVGVTFSLLAAGPMIWYGRYANRPPRVREWWRSGMVIGPRGLALVQGELHGFMRWGEILDIFRQSDRILIVFDGGRLAIRDLYDRPLGMIYRRMLRYWLPPRGLPRYQRLTK